MLGVAPAQLLSPLRIRAIPEAAQIARHLHRPAVRREQRQHDGFALTTDARRLREAEELLQLDRDRDAAVLVVFERMAPTARDRERLRRVALERADEIGRERAFDAHL